MLYEELAANLETPVEFYVYNSDSDEVRIPSPQYYRIVNKKYKTYPNVTESQLIEVKMLKVKHCVVLNSIVLYCIEALWCAELICTYADVLYFI